MYTDCFTHAKWKVCAKGTEYIKKNAQRSIDINGLVNWLWDCHVKGCNPGLGSLVHCSLWVRVDCESNAIYLPPINIIKLGYQSQNLTKWSCIRCSICTQYNDKRIQSRDVFWLTLYKYFHMPLMRGGLYPRYNIRCSL